MDLRMVMVRRREERREEGDWEWVVRLITEFVRLDALFLDKIRSSAGDGIDNKRSTMSAVNISKKRK